jgi:hypothetical protein
MSEPNEENMPPLYTPYVKMTKRSAFLAWVEGVSVAVGVACFVATALYLGSDDLEARLFAIGSVAAAFGALLLVAMYLRKDDGNELWTVGFLMFMFGTIFVIGSFFPDVPPELVSARVACVESSGIEGQLALIGDSETAQRYTARLDELTALAHDGGKGLTSVDLCGSVTDLKVNVKESVKVSALG